MMTLRLAPERASLATVAEELGVAEGELDADFGVVEIDPDRHRYAVMIEERAAARVGRRPGVEGPFANPAIEPFGPGS